MSWTYTRERSNGEDHLKIKDGDRTVLEMHDVDFYPWVTMPNDEDVAAICRNANRVWELEVKNDELIKVIENIQAFAHGADIEPVFQMSKEALEKLKDNQ
jgi:hypothetical protein